MLIDLPYEQLKFLPFETEITIDGEKGNYVGTANDKRGSLGYTIKDLLDGDSNTTKRLKGKRIQIEKTEYEKSIKWFNSVMEYWQQDTVESGRVTMRRKILPDGTQEELA